MPLNQQDKLSIIAEYAAEVISHLTMETERDIVKWLIPDVEIDQDRDKDTENF